MFEYTPTIEDGVAFSMAILDNSGKAALQQRRLWFTGLGASLLVLMVPVAFVVFTVTGPINPLLGVLVTWLLCTLPWLGTTLVWPELPRRWLTWIVRKQVKRRRRTQPLVAMKIWLDKNGLGVATASGQTHLAWCAISGVGETPRHIFILIVGKAGFVLPKRVDPAGVAVFATQLRIGAAANREPQPTAFAAQAPHTTETVSVDEAEPHEWVPPMRVMPLSAFAPGSVPPSSSTPPATGAQSFPTTAPPTLTFTTSLNDLISAVLDFPPRFRVRERLILKAGWRRWAVFAIDGLLFIVICQLFFHLPTGWAVFGAVALLGVSALLQWSRLDHAIKRKLPAILEKGARLILAGRGDYRRVWADATGMTVADAIFTNQVRWERLTLLETDRHVIVGSAVISVAIPRHVGQPLLDFVRVARSSGVG